MESRRETAVLAEVNRICGTYRMTCETSQDERGVKRIVFEKPDGDGVLHEVALPVESGEVPTWAELAGVTSRSWQEDESGDEMLTLMHAQLLGEFWKLDCEQRKAMEATAAQESSPDRAEKAPDGPPIQANVKVQIARKR